MPHERRSSLRRRRNAQEPAQQVVDSSLGVGGAGRQHHGPHVDVEDVARHELDPLVGHHVAAVTAVAGVVLLVRVGQRVGGGVALLGRRRDRHALGQPLAHLPVDAGHPPVRMPELLERGREQHRAHRVAALEQRRRRDPGPSARPAGHVRRVEQLLAQAAGEAVHVGHRGRPRRAELAVGRDEQRDRALDLGGDRRRAVEVARREDRPQQRLQFVARFAQATAKLHLERGLQILPHQVAVHLAGDELAGRRLLEDDVEHFLAAQLALTPEEGLRAAVVELGVEPEVEDVVGPARERPRRLPDVLLGVVADAHREQLEQLAAEVLVRVVLHVLPVVEVDEHRRVAHDGEQQAAEVAGGVLAQGPVLQVHLAGVADLDLRRREVVVPEEGHLLFQRARRGRHAVAPPQGQPARFQHVAAQAVEELVDDRLDRPRRTLGQDLDAQRPPVPPRPPHGRGAAGWERVHAFVPDARRVERREAGIVDRLVVHQPGDRAFQAERRERLDLVRRTAETGPLQEMRRLLVAEVRLGQRRQIADPGVTGRIDRRAHGRRAQGRRRRREAERGGPDSRCKAESSAHASLQPASPRSCHRMNAADDSA